MSVIPHTRVRALIAVAVVLTAALVWVASALQGRAIERADRQSRAADRMLVSMLDQETGFRGFALSGDEAFLEPFIEGRREFDRAVAEAREHTDEDREAATRFIDTQVAIARRWRALAEQGVQSIRSRGRLTVSMRQVRQRKAQTDLFRDVNADFKRQISDWRRRERAEAGRHAVLLILGLSLLFGALGWHLLKRTTHAELERQAADRDYRETQGDFAETMQVAQDEAEANGLLKRHLERTLPSSTVVVLNRNNSANRLEPATPVPAGSAIALGLEGAEPRSCLAVRMGREHSRGPGHEPLLACDVCGEVARDSTCQPVLVSGEVIGSVLVEHPEPLDEQGDRRLTESVRQAAPVLANLRNLAIAETRAATDVLTGLPNNRAVQDTLKRMVAQSGRSLEPLAMALLDLDHFKRINDTYGHGKGDEVLASVGDALSNAIRSSDFVGRYGGEEFVILMPGTDREGALVAAEKLRGAIASVKVAGVGGQVTASLGLAVLPDDAGDSEMLMRRADRALYAAKARGRNRVESAEAVGPRPLDADID